MRYIICEEATDVIVDRFIVEGSLRCEDEELTISHNFDFESSPIGMAKDIRREDGGIWTAEIAMFGGYEVSKLDGFSVYITPVIYHMWKDVAWCTDGVIRGVALIPGYQFWPQHNEG